MYSINRENIVPFIAQLYRERKHTEAPQALLESWANLSDEEIDKNLTGLFESWGMGLPERERAIERFLASRRTPIIPPNAEPEIFHTASAPKKSISTWIWAGLILILLGGGYLGFQYVRYLSLGRVYAITENIMVRDAQGKEAARMDLFPKTQSAFTSYNSLRVLDDEIHFIQPRGSDKEYPTRRVLLDEATFADFLLRQDELAHFVNINYIVNDKREFDLYQNAFRELQAVPSDNASLLAAYRKIIVGSMVQQNDLQGRYLLARAANLNPTLLKNTSSYILIENQKNKLYTIIAGLDDGKYYRFAGDVSTNTFLEPVPVLVQTPDGQIGELTGNYRFVKNGTQWKLFNTDDNKTTDYFLSIEQNYQFVYRDPAVLLQQQLEEKARLIEESYQQQIQVEPQPPRPTPPSD